MFIFVHKCSHTAKIQSLFGDSAPARWTTPPRRSLRPFSGQRPWDVWVMARHIASHLITYYKAMSILQDTTSICVTMSMVESKFFFWLVTQTCLWMSQCRNACLDELKLVHCPSVHPSVLYLFVCTTRSLPSLIVGSFCCANLCLPKPFPVMSQNLPGCVTILK